VLLVETQGAGPAAVPLPASSCRSLLPGGTFRVGKPDAHWLLDEAGAIVVAATRGVERKRLGWQRRDDWGSHPQLAHQLQTSRL
jgi:hypothetical protein